MICQNCGSENREQAKYCARCGAKMKYLRVQPSDTPETEFKPASDAVVETAFTPEADAAKHTVKHMAPHAKEVFVQTVADAEEVSRQADKNEKRTKKKSKRASALPQPQNAQANADGIQQALPVTNKVLTAMCTQCGSAIGQTAVFCLRCGARQADKQVGGSPAVQQPEQAAAPVQPEAKNIESQPQAQPEPEPALETKPIQQEQALRNEQSVVGQEWALNRAPVQKAEEPAPVANGMLCAVCGTAIPQGVPYCNKCGSAASSAVTQKQPQKRRWKWAVGVVAAIILLVGGLHMFTQYRASQYAIAVEDMEAGRYDDAYQIFSKLGKYEEAPAYASYCEAHVLFEQEQYEAAQQLFMQLRGCEDADAKAQACQNYIDYERAAQYCEQGNYYEAYLCYQLLGDFLDSASLKYQCVQEMPPNGIMYINPDYAGEDVTFTIINEMSQNSYMRIYEGDTLVASIFIRGDERVVIALKKGDYGMYKAMGLQWFGEADMFGDNGTYNEILFEAPDGSGVASHRQFGYDAIESYNLTINAETGLPPKDIGRHDFR